MKKTMQQIASEAAETFKDTELLKVYSNKPIDMGMVEGIEWAKKQLTMKQNIYYNGRIYIEWEKGVLNFHSQIKHLTSYLYTGTNLKDGQVVVENVDYEFKHEHYTGFPPYTQWETCKKEDYHIYDDLDKRIVAIPKEQPVNSIISGGEESQDELWNKVGAIFYGSSSFKAYHFVQKELQEQFTIQKRKQ